MPGRLGWSARFRLESESKGNEGSGAALKRFRSRVRNRLGAAAYLRRRLNITPAGIRTLSAAIMVPGSGTAPPEELRTKPAASSAGATLAARGILGFGVGAMGGGGLTVGGATVTAVGASTGGGGGTNASGFGVG